MISSPLIHGANLISARLNSVSYLILSNEVNQSMFFVFLCNIIFVCRNGIHVLWRFEGCTAKTSFQIGSGKCHLKSPGGSVVRHKAKGTKNEQFQRNRRCRNQKKPIAVGSLSNVYHAAGDIKWLCHGPWRAY